jgi:hypothetical protein
MQFYPVFYTYFPVLFNSVQEMFEKMYRALANFFKTGVVTVIPYLVAEINFYRHFHYHIFCPMSIKLGIYLHIMGGLG